MKNVYFIRGLATNEIYLFFTSLDEINSYSRHTLNMLYDMCIYVHVKRNILGYIWLVYFSI